MRTLILGVSLALGLSITAQAHHSFAHFEEGWTELEGTLVRLRWQNPHIYFFLETEEANGEKKLWEMETGTIYMIGRAGVTRDMFTEGETLRVAGHTSHVYPNQFHLKNVLLPDGREVITVANSPARWSEEVIGGRNQWRNEALHANEVEVSREGFFRVWSPASPGTIQDPLFPGGNPRLDELMTDASREVRDAWDAYAFDNNCELPGMPRVNYGPHPHQFIDNKDFTITFTSDEFNVPRTFHLHSAVDPETVAPSPLGYSVAHWEDARTLVVETTRINFPYMQLSGAGQSEQVEMVERFVLGANNDRIDYMITITDPVMLTGPYIQTGTWIDLNEAMGTYDCVVVADN